MERVLIERSVLPGMLTNTYLVAAASGGQAFLVDAGGPIDPLARTAQAQGLEVTHVLLTHHHGDHIEGLGDVLEAWPAAEVLAHPEERVPGVTGTLEDGDDLEAGGLPVRVLHTPGHSAGMLAFLVDGTDVFDGDTLFRGSVGGVRAPGSTGYEDLKRSIMDVLLALPGETRVHPGHVDPTTVAREWEENPFVRVWRGLDPEGNEPVTALGEPARLVLLAPDYDGGTKAWVRWPDGRDDIVPGSRLG